MLPLTYRIRRSLTDLAEAIYRERQPLQHLRMMPLGTNIPPDEMAAPDRDAKGWRSVAVGDHWGGQDQNAWFHADVTIPADWMLKTQNEDTLHAIALRFRLGSVPHTDFGWPEGLLYFNGNFLQGINQHHIDLVLPQTRVRDGHNSIDVRAWSGMLLHDHRLESAECALINCEVETLYHLLWAGCDLVDALNESDALRQPLLQALEQAWIQIDLRQPATALLDESAQRALTTLRASLARLRAEYNPSTRPSVTAIGHGHLDVAWLWQTRHTREKAARTFSATTALMNQYSEYVYLHTTPQVYDWLAQDYPHIFDQVKERVAEGRIEAAGAMWLEPDTNMISGESLVRQILYGQRYLRETFDRDYDILWLPDSFGYTFSLPQIMLRSGIKAIMTIKMSWHDSTNRVPYDTFRWRGLDGSETLAHFVTTPWLPGDSNFDNDFDNDTYSARFIVPALRRLYERYRNKQQNQELLFIFGRGDGGAGPTRQHLERYYAIRDLPGLPAVKLGRADEYFHALRERVWNDSALPTWDGELYLEYHRGVYTTQAWLKRLHRRVEEKLLLTESLDTMTWARARHLENAVTDQRAILDNAWRTLLLHQFHDILPGSSISAVYEDAKHALTDLANQLDRLIDRFEHELTASGSKPTASGKNWVVHNPSPCATPGQIAVAQLPLAADGPLPTFLMDSRKLSAQEVIDAEGVRLALVAMPPLAGRGWSAVEEIPNASPERRIPRRSGKDGLFAVITEDGGAHLENAYYDLTLDSQGRITSLRDKRVPDGRELIAIGHFGNHFVAFDDRPADFDAWDIDIGYPLKPYPLTASSLRVTENGPVRSTVHVTRKFLGSVVEQDISLYRDLPRIDFATHIEWHEHHVLLKVEFPLDLRTTHARSEIQYGSIIRPTYRNTSWDQSRFETVAHRWVDLSEANYGVALLNNGCYGHDIHNSGIRLTILRSPTSPDPHADQGTHEVTYSLLPHLGAWPTGEVIAHGYMLNQPLRVQRAGGRVPSPLFASDNSTVIVETIKRASEGEDLVVRLYESTGGRTMATISCDYPVVSVTETDLLERPLVSGVSPAYTMWSESTAASHDVPILTNTGWACQFRPFEIRTFRVHCQYT